MKMEDREAVAGTVPVITIGHRVRKNKKTGKSKASKWWEADYCHLGRKHHEPLNTTNKSQAIKAAWAIVQRLDRGESRHVHRRVEWQEMRDQHLDNLRGMGRKPKTMTKYTSVIDHFIEHAKAKKRARPDECVPADLWSFNALMMELNHSPKTRSGRLIIIKSWFKWAHLRNLPPLITTNPFAAERVKEPSAKPQPCFEPWQVEKLLAAADKECEGPLYAVLAYVGLRIGEARELQWDDIKLHQGEYGWVVIRRGGSVEDETKTGGIRRIPIHPELRPILERLPRREDGLVLHQKPSAIYPEGGRPLDAGVLLKSLKRNCEECKFIKPKQFKLHTFRHAFASMMARNNVSYKYALEFMGHKDSSILDLYYKMFDKTAEAAIASIKYTATGEAKTAS